MKSLKTPDILCANDNRLSVSYCLSNSLTRIVRATAIFRPMHVSSPIAPGLWGSAWLVDNPDITPVLG